MTRRSRHLIAHVVVGTCALAVLLTGCTGAARPALTAQPPATTAAAPIPVPTVTSDAADLDAACVDGVARLNGSDLDLTLVGTCPRVEISGTDLDVTLRAAMYDEVVVRGDRNDVEALSVSALSIEGTENEWDGQDAGSLAISGDRNELDFDGTVGAIAVAGNDNEVEAAVLGAIDDAGDRNRFETR